MCVASPLIWLAEVFCMFGADGYVSCRLCRIGVRLTHTESNKYRTYIQHDLLHHEFDLKDFVKWGKLRIPGLAVVALVLANW